MSAITELHALRDRLAPSARMPVVFLGHGSPMNAIQSNRFTQTLTRWGEALGRPRAILMVSAHWLTERDTRVSTIAKPPTADPPNADVNRIDL